MQLPSNDEFMPGAPDSAGIISSLISTFSVLGAAPSPELHSDHLFGPDTTDLHSFATSLSSPSSPRFDRCYSSASLPSSALDVDRSRLRHSLVPSTGFGMDYGAFRAPRTDHDYDISHPDEAAIAPVVRMVKTPSSLSPTSKNPSSSKPNPSARPEFLQNLGRSASYRGHETTNLDLLDLQSLSQKGSRASLASTLSGKSFKSFRLPKDACSRNVSGNTSCSSAHRTPALKSVRSIPSMSGSLNHHDNYNTPHVRTPLSPSIAGPDAFHAGSSPALYGGRDSTRTSFSGTSKCNHNPIASQLRFSTHEPSISSLQSDITFQPSRLSYIHPLDSAIESDPEDHLYEDDFSSPTAQAFRKQQRTFSHNFVAKFGDIDENLGLPTPYELNRFHDRYSMAEDNESHHFHDHTANGPETPQTNSTTIRGRAPSVYSHERDGQVFDNLDMLASTLDTGVSDGGKPYHWLKIKDQTLTEDSESAPAPAVSTRATRPSSLHRRSSSSRKHHTIRTNTSPTAPGVKLPTEKRKPPTNAGDVKHHARRHLRRSQIDSATQMASTNVDRHPQCKSRRSHSFSGSFTRTAAGDNTIRPQHLQPQPQVNMRPSSSDSIDTAVDDFLLAPRLNRTVQHPAEDRIIAFSDVGDPNGRAVFVCLGMGLTRYVMAFYDDLARVLKLRLITPDRPGVGGSDPCDESRAAPLTWPDDIAIICNHLKITRFSLLAHSAGAIYALATALRMPQHINGRIHLLAPWIPPSQIEMSNISIIKGTSSKSADNASKTPKMRSLAMPYSQRLLKALPTPIFKVANAGFMSVTSASVSTSSSKHASRKKRWKNSPKNPAVRSVRESAVFTDKATDANTCMSLGSPMSPPLSPQNMSALPKTSTSKEVESPTHIEPLTEDVQLAIRQRNVEFDARLTDAIWELATTNTNPSIDLLVCLERRQPIGFRYADVSRPVVIHHGARDTRVPIENVRWLGRTMQHCEVNVLEQEGHSLMANAAVMGNVLTEIAHEWDSYTRRHPSEQTDHTPGPSARQTVSANG